MCSRIGTITEENKHCFGKAIGGITKEAVRCQKNQRTRGKKQSVCAAEKEPEPVSSR